MATNPTYAPPMQTEGPFGVQGQHPGAPLSSMRAERPTPSNRLLWTALGAAGASLLWRAVRPRNASMLLAPLLLYGFKKLRNR